MGGGGTVISGDGGVAGAGGAVSEGAGVNIKRLRYIRLGLLMVLRIWFKCKRFCVKVFAQGKLMTVPNFLFGIPLCGYMGF